MGDIRLQHWALDQCIDQAGFANPYPTKQGNAQAPLLQPLQLTIQKPQFTPSSPRSLALSCS